ncbi:lytic transglycosylase domain-containing protein [Methylomonas paludis]|uniref:Lytic transglycosylase domain-containing protein n=2 Tax=Methylomonas paludis TaxID=1173101 RepID=A0A975MRZ1_9GAMM|nr:lytic transglycosylase domain-containing protein [Methylomonas paludis]
MLLLNACGSSSPKKDNLSLVKPDVIAQRPQQRSQFTEHNSVDHSKVVYSGVFPKPMALEPAVDFWRKTYAIWPRSQVAVHDDRYLDIVYEVVTVPGNVGEGLTIEQKEFVSQRREYWKSQLAGLEAKLRYGAELNAHDRHVINKYESTGKPLSFINGASDRVRTQRGTRERFKRGLEISGRYDRQFRKIFREAGLPEDFAYLPHVESSFQVAAKSSAGAVGLWQFTKSAAKTFIPGHDSVDRRMDPIVSANGAARYLSHAYGKLGNWPTAVTSYNHGIGGMKRAQNQIGPDFTRIVEQYDGPAFGFASRNYYAQFLAAREIASNPQQYYSEGILYETPGDNSQLLAYK